MGSIRRPDSEGARDKDWQRAPRRQPFAAILIAGAVAITGIGFAAPSSLAGTLLFSAVGGASSFALGIWRGTASGFSALGSLMTVAPLAGGALFAALAIGVVVGLVQALLWRTTLRRDADPIVSALVSPGIWGAPILSGVATVAVNIAAACFAAMLLSSLTALVSTTGALGLEALAAISQVISGGPGGHDNVVGWVLEVALFLGGLLGFGCVAGAATGAASGGVLAWLIGMVPISAARGAAEGGLSAAFGPRQRADGLVAVGVGAFVGAVEGAVAGMLSALVIGLAPVFGLHL